MDLDANHKADQFGKIGSFMCKDGVAKERGKKNSCKKRVCFVTSDRNLLMDILLEVAQGNDCFDVKFSIESRLGIYLGICHLTNESSTGDIWAKYQVHPKVWVTLQDEEFCDFYRSKIPWSL